MRNRAHAPQSCRLNQGTHDPLALRLAGNPFAEQFYENGISTSDAPTSMSPRSFAKRTSQGTRHRSKEPRESRSLRSVLSIGERSVSDGLLATTEVRSRPSSSVQPSRVDDERIADLCRSGSGLRARIRFVNHHVAGLRLVRRQRAEVPRLHYGRDIDHRAAQRPAMRTRRFIDRSGLHVAYADTSSFSPGSGPFVIVRLPEENRRRTHCALGAVLLPPTKMPALFSHERPIPP